MSQVILRAGIRDVSLTAALLNGTVSCEGFTFRSEVASPYTETFRLMARDLAYDLAEMPLATLLLAVDARK